TADLFCKIPRFARSPSPIHPREGARIGSILTREIRTEPATQAKGTRRLARTPAQEVSMTFKTPAVRYGVVLASLVLAFALAPAALAGKAGGGGKPGGGHLVSGGQTITGVVGSTTFTVTGSGFQPNQFLALSIGVANGCCSATNVTADATGHFTYT